MSQQPKKLQRTKAKKGRKQDGKMLLRNYMEWVENLDGRLAFRGQADADWELDSSAYRRLKEKIKPHSYAEHSLFVGYLHERVNEVLMRFSEHGDKQPLEVMAHLQHHGAATGLIDFTENALAALWFACKDHPEKNGKVFALRLDEPEKIEEIKTREKLQGELKDFFGERNPPDKLQAWRPGDSDIRMVTQQSLFIFGRPSIGEEFFHGNPYEVQNEEKESLRGILERSGISETFMFSDFSGFAAANANGKAYNFVKTRAYLDEKIRTSGEQKALLYFERGNLNSALECYEEALADYDEAIRLEPRGAGAHINRGNTLCDLGRHEKALAAYNKAIALDPENADAYNNRGNVLRDLDCHKKALEDYDTAIALDPEYAEAHYNRGCVLRDLGRHKEALKAYDMAIALDSKYADAYNNRGVALYDLNRHEEALVAYDKAIALNPKHAMAHSNRGEVLNHLGRHREALVACDKAIALDPKYAEAHLHRGNALHDLEHLNEACAAWAEAQRRAELSGDSEVTKKASKNLGKFCEDNSK